MPATYLKLEALLGTKLDAVNAAAVRRLIENKAVEDEDLDFKREPHTDGQEFAVDVASMANTRGGLLVLGVDEDANGRASDAKPFALTDERVRTMKQWLAEYVVPYVPTVIKQVPEEGDATTGYLVVIVPKSPNAPHAVRKKATLRYSRRDGPRNLPLSESEVADRYRDRFRGERAQVDRFEQVRLDGTRPVVIDKADVWVVMTLVPSTPGEMTLSLKRVRDIQQWAQQYGPNPGDGPFGRWSPQASTGVARVIITSSMDAQRPPRSGYVELHTDGSGFASHSMPHGELSAGHVAGDQLFSFASGLLNLLAGHAVVNAGTSGDALVRCELLVNAGERMELGYWQFGSFFEQYPLTRALLAPMPEVRTHTLNLDSVVGSAVEQLAATRLLVTDLFQAFGMAEVPHVTAEGHLNVPYWDKQTLAAWNRVADVPRVSFDVMRAR